MRKALFVLLSSALFASLTTAQAAEQTVVETNHGWVSYHSEARLASPILGRLQLGEKAVLIEKTNRWWYEISVNGNDVYITTNSHFTHIAHETVQQPQQPEQSAPTNPSGDPTTQPSAPTPATSEPAWQVQADKVIATAKTQIGVTYWWGHQVPYVGFDCSNFTSWAYKTALGTHFSSSSEYQRFHVGTPVPLDEIREGDLLFFKTSGNASGGGHVGIYAGNGMIIQEGGGRAKVTFEPMAGTWFARDLVYARRVIQ